jgi:hypothetical protein
MADDEDPNDREEIESDDDDNDDISEEGDGMDDSVESSSDDEDTIDNEIVEKFIRTFHSGNYDVEFDDALNYDQSVIVPVRPTQASYTKPDNWRERNRIGLVRVQAQLQTCIDSLAPDLSCGVNLRLNRNSSRWGQQLLDNEEPIVWHEAILDESWSNLDAAIDQYRQLKIDTDISGIDVENVEIKKERLAALVAMFLSGRANNSSTMIQFDNTNICEEGIVCLSKLVDVSSNLQSLSISHNRIDNMESARCLFRSLKSHTRINILSLAHCDLGSTPEILSVILKSDVKYIFLNNNNIDSLGAVKIAEYIGCNPPIYRIDLDCNRLNDDDATLISQALKLNTNLRHLDIEKNNFTSIGVKALLTCVFDSSSLNALSESNSMRIDIINCGNHNLQHCIDRLLELDQFQKIVLALQDKDSLLKYLANVPVELIPEVLAFPRERFVGEHKRKHLNIVYSTMRWWNMPLLYSYQNCVKSDAKRKRND